MTIWIDVQDLFDYAETKSRPSGIQRLAFELSRALRAHDGETGDGEAGGVRFVRHDLASEGFREVAWSDVEDLYRRLVGPESRHGVRRAARVPPPSAARRSMRLRIHRLPVALRLRLIDALVAQLHALRAMLVLLDAVAGAVTECFQRVLSRPKPEQTSSGAVQQSTAVTRASFAQTAAPGDTLFIPGSPWSHPDYALLAEGQRRAGLRVVLLVYDIIPLLHPEWCDVGMSRIFRTCYTRLLPLCDRVLAISRSTASDLTAYAAANDLALSHPVTPIPIGGTFDGGAIAARDGTGSPAAFADALPDTPYVLFVSTIEARKNHLLLFNVWRRLLYEMPPDQVPALVFAGQIGWLVDDLMAQIANTNYLSGKLIIVEKPPDVLLAALYTGCAFTVFPSLYEGWGLPVSESLAFGKPCLIADRASLPEAGGRLARWFDPDDPDDAYAAVRAIISDPEDLAFWTETVRREATPARWSDSAHAVFSAIQEMNAMPRA